MKVRGTDWDAEEDAKWGRLCFHIDLPSGDTCTVSLPEACWSETVVAFTRATERSRAQRIETTAPRSSATGLSIVVDLSAKMLPSQVSNTALATLRA